MMKKRLFMPLFILFIILSYTLSISGAVNVQPLVINIEMAPGETKDFELILTTGPQREQVSIEIMTSIQDINGRLSYHEGNPELNPAIEWIELDRTEMNLPASERTIINGTVNAPFNASGSHTVILMVDQNNSANNDGERMLGFRIRYAVRVNIHIERPGQRPQINVLDYGLEMKDDKPIISLHFNNPSQFNFPVVADVTIRDESRYLVQRVPLVSPSSSLERRDNFRIYPGSELIFQGEITEPLYGGSYELQLFFRYADGRQIVQRKTIDIGDEYLREESIRYLSLDPEEFDFTVNAGGTNMQILELRNRSREPIIVRTSNSEVKPEYDNSFFLNAEVQINGDEQFILQPNVVSRQLMRFVLPRDIEPGGYYGFREIEVYNQNQELLETHRIPINTIVRGEIEIDINILDLAYNETNGDGLFSLTLENTGNIHIIPRATLQLIDKDEEIYANINLSQEVEQIILPEYMDYLTGSRANITPGEYKAIVTVLNNGEELSKREFEIIISEYNTQEI